MQALTTLADAPKPDGMGERDVRHVYHPMLQNEELSKSSDLDAIFVGTASCTPGVTRGVSCTALRLNWKRRGRSAVAKAGGGDGGSVNGEGMSVERAVEEGVLGGDGRYEEGENTSAGGTWIFDCGESTQLSIQRTGSVRPSKITKIFVSHAHGDHSFGLPGLLCLMGSSFNSAESEGSGRPSSSGGSMPVVDIYGPEGLRMWLRVAVRYSVSRIVPPYRVHELMDVPLAPEWTEGRRTRGRYYLDLQRRANGARGAGRQGGGGGGLPWSMQGLAGEDPNSWISRAPRMDLERSSDFGEVEGGRDIFPVYDHPLSVDGAPIWEVEDEGDVRCRAAPMSHSVPCVGYVVEEERKPGRLRPDLVQPVVMRNFDALRKAGMRAPMKVMQLIKDLPEGGSFEFPDGTVLAKEDVVEPDRDGRKVVVCGDTADARALDGLARGADLVIHEATNAYLAGVDRDTNLELVTKDAIVHGHSTPQMAGAFARRVGARRLVLNHFSSRYKGDQTVESMSIMGRIEQQAMKASGLPEDAVAAAWDMMVLPIPQK